MVAESASAPCAAMGRTRVGIISGAGPEAGVDILQKVLAVNRTRLAAEGKYLSDRDAPYLTLFQVPGIGGPREELDLAEETNKPYKLVWHGFQETLDIMSKCGISRFCISCNTLHVLEPRIRTHLAQHKHLKSLELVSLIDEVKKQVVAIAAEKGLTKVAILGSIPTTDIDQASPYRRLAGTENVQLVALAQEHRIALQRLIDAVKVDGPDAPEMGRLVLEIVEQYDADVFVLACTELPLVVKNLQACKGKRLLDPGSLVAEELLREDLERILVKKRRTSLCVP